MIVPKPDPIALTPKEQDLFDRIDFELSGEYTSRLASLAAGADLAESLLRRGAVPEVRRRYLTDPELNIGGRGKSRIDRFARNGKHGREVLEHPHFLSFYLRYLIFGPDLPEASIERFRKILIDDAGTSGMILDQLCRCARTESRQLGRHDGGEELFKLALECGIDESGARSVRDAAMRAR